MILILDDDQEALDLLVWQLAKSGIRDVIAFSDEQLFLDALDKGTVIVVLDHYLMTGRTGLDVMKVVLQRHPVIYSIILSGTEDPRVILEYLNHDAFRYVVKRSAGSTEQVVRFINQAKARAALVANYFKK